MRLSLQTVSIIFGVTLVHLFVIAAVSPVEGEWSGTLPKIEIDPALESLFDEMVTGLNGDIKTDLAGESVPGEMTDLRINPASGENRIEEAPSPTAQNLAEINSTKAEPSGSDEATALESPRQIRHIRSLQPIPRS